MIELLPVDAYSQIQYFMSYATWHNAKNQVKPLWNGQFHCNFVYKVWLIFPKLLQNSWLVLGVQIPVKISQIKFWLSTKKCTYQRNVSWNINHFIIDSIHVYASADKLHKNPNDIKREALSLDSIWQLIPPSMLPLFVIHLFQKHCRSYHEFET